MNVELESLLRRYEDGTITRRELLVALAAVASTGAAAQTAQPSVGAVKQLNHVTIFVEDVGKSVAFFQRLFGMPVLTRQVPGINLVAGGGGFLGIYPAQGRPTGINHVCFGLEDFDADATLTKLKGQGLDAGIRLRGDTKELYLNAPDNVLVQLQDVRYRGGVGPLGDRDPR